MARDSGSQPPASPAPTIAPPIPAPPAAARNSAVFTDVAAAPSLPSVVVESAASEKPG